MSIKMERWGLDGRSAARLRAPPPPSSRSVWSFECHYCGFGPRHGDAPPGRCPKCGGSLYEATYEGIAIDVCNKCTGVWLDAGELAQIAIKDEESKGWFGKLFG